MDANTEYENYRKRMEEFPCAFNLVGADKVTMTKFRSIQHNLDSELAINDNCENEQIIKLNMLTWVRFRLGEQDEAVQLSNDAVDSTGGRNVASLGNRFFVMWQTGDELGAKKCLEDLEKMKSEENFHTQLTDAQAEQAYYYSRLGGPSNLKRAIDIFSALPKTPINYLRKFGCGLVYRRMTHVNIFCSSSKPLTVPDYQRLAAECLFEVADNADSRLKSLAYAQLANLRRSYPSNPRNSYPSNPRNSYPSNPRNSYPSNPRNSYPSNLRNSYPSNPRNSYPSNPRNSYPSNPRNSYPSNPRNSYPSNPRNSYPSNPRNSYPSNPRNSYPSNPRNSYPSNPRNSYPSNPRNSYPSNPRNSYPSNRRRSYPFNRRRSYPSNLSPEVGLGVGLFRGLGVKQLCDKAVEHGEDIPAVLTQCGKAIKPFDIDQAIEWLTKSVKIKDNSDAYHHLGICYKRKAEGAAEGNPPLKNTAEELRDHDCMGQQEAGRQITGQSHDVSRTSGSMNYTHTQMNDRPLDMSQTFEQTCGQTAYMGVDDGHWDNQNVQVDKASCVNDNVENYGECGSKHGETVAESMPSAYSSEDLIRGPIPDSENHYINDNCFYIDNINQEQNKASENNTFTDPMVETQTGSVQHVPDTSFHLYDDLQYKPVAGSNSTHESEGPGWNSPNLEFRPSIDIGFVRGNTQSTGRRVRNSKRNRSTFSGERWEPKPILKSSMRRCRRDKPLNKDNENVQEALNCFKKAIKIAKVNLPAVLDLGLLLKQTNQIDEALKQFNSITNNSNSSISHRVTVISAYEQAGLCYLQLSQIEGNNDYKEMAKNKLTRAVSMAADLALIMPELQGSHKDVWVAFTTLITEIDKEQAPKNHQLHQKIKVLELARDYGAIVDVIQKLKEIGQEELTNQDIIKTALDSYLELKQPDNALGFHNLVSMNPAVKDSDWWNANPMRSLRVKVLLHAISGRLREISDSPTVLFQQLFELVFGSCFGLRDPDNDQQNDTDSVVFGDVLFVFDTDESPEEESMYPTVKSARCLKRLSAWLFGLETQENLKRTGAYGDQCQIQLDEMLKYQVVIIVLGEETRNRLFNAMLERVSYNKREKAPPNQKILVIDAGLHGGEIPQYLKQFKSLKLEDIGILGQLQTAPESWSDSDNISFTDIINHVGVDAVLKLFCFMIEQTWPCP